MSAEEFERLLRATLAEQAAGAPDPERLAGRVLAAIDVQAQSPDAVSPVALDMPTPIERAAARSRQRRSVRLLVPLAAAASVAAVVGLGVALTSGNSSKNASTASAGDAEAAASQPYNRISEPAGATPSSAGSATATSTAAPIQPSSPPSEQSAYIALPPGFQLSDLTYDSTTTAFGLGTVPCATGRCTALARSSAPRTWRAVNATLPFTVAGATDPQRSAADRVSRIRFASATVGYAFGNQALFVTEDGGRNWTRTASMTTAVEVAGATAVSVQTLSCSGSTCNYQISTGAPGAAAFTPAAVPVALTGTAVTLARAGNNAFVAVDAGSSHPLLSSVDGGVTWTQASTDVCPATGVVLPTGLPSSAADTGSTARSSATDTPARTTPTIAVTSLAAAPDGSMTALCSSSAGQFVAVSTDAGRTVTTAAVPSSAAASAVTAASARVLVVGGSTLMRSSDGGRTWSSVAGVPLLGSTRWLGFEDPTHGVWVGGDARSVWSSTDAGSTFIEYAFT